MLAEMVGVKPTNVSRWMERESFDIRRVYEACPGVSARFLITGEGGVMEEDTEALRAQLRQKDEMIEMLRREIVRLEAELKKK